ncbi:MAG: C39 family peptidase [Selenomonadaceae bacterium]|nr:C39 family peptidase [Selenomonadaceae bacterium]
MKKIFVALILALTVGCACDEEIPDYGGAASAPADINHADSIYFTHVDISALTSTDSRIILTNYPTALQSTDYSCGPVAALTVLNYFGNRDFDEATLIKKMHIKPLIGTSLSDMVKFFRDIGWEVHSRLDTPPIKDNEAFKKFVVDNLSAGTPIMVENVEYGGHWRVIVGYDTLGTENLFDDMLIFADPFDTSDHKSDGFAVGSADRFFNMWFDHSVLPENEREQPWLTAKPK